MRSPSAPAFSLCSSSLLPTYLSASALFLGYPSHASLPPARHVLSRLSRLSWPARTLRPGAAAVSCVALPLAPDVSPAHFADTGSHRDSNRAARQHGAWPVRALSVLRQHHCQAERVHLVPPLSRRCPLQRALILLPPLPLSARIVLVVHTNRRAYVSINLSYNRLACLLLAALSHTTRLPRHIRRPTIDVPHCIPTWAPSLKRAVDSPAHVQNTPVT